MKGTLSSILSSLDADYADINHQENKKGAIACDRKEFHRTFSYFICGGRFRADRNGGRTTPSFIAFDQTGPTDK